jgi:hypothetical protein
MDKMLRAAHDSAISMTMVGFQAQTAEICANDFLLPFSQKIESPYCILDMLPDFISAFGKPDAAMMMNAGRKIGRSNMTTGMTHVGRT